MKKDFKYPGKQWWGESLKTHPPFQLAYGICLHYYKKKNTSILKSGKQTGQTDGQAKIYTHKMCLLLYWI